jgi:hypothetical protein
VQGRLEFAAVGCGLMGLGFLVALWTAFGGGTYDRERRTAWSVGAAGVFALALVGGAQVIVASARLADQSSSAYLEEVPSALLGLACSVLLPVLLLVMAFELAHRRRRHAGKPLRRRAAGRRRRHRVTEP